ncbi:MAG: alpha/beta hydrolase [Flavobacteriales bacterium]|nr:MAG: alpha/beta hydrolase [Flavobacteriales bacterium]
MSRNSILYSNVIGKGEPLLILHGFLGSGDNWKTLARKFAEGDNGNSYEVHLIDQRNHGRSFHSLDFTYELMANDIIQYLEEHGLKNVNLLGHSMGGKMAMFFAVNNPEKVNKLVVADIGPKYYPVHHQVIMAALNSVDFTKQKSRGEVEDVISKYIKDWGVRQFLLKNVYWKEKGVLAFRFNLSGLTDKLEEIGKALPHDSVFKKDTLFLRGEKSDYILGNDEPLIKQHFPNSHITAIRNAGHWLHAENPDDFYDAVVRFLTGVTINH